MTLQTSDVTLSGSGGRLPITVLNGSAKDLKVQVVASSDQLAFPKGPSLTTVVKPGESFVTIPVDLGQGLAGRVKVTVRAGDVELASSSLTIRASFLNQLVIVAAIVGGADRPAALRPQQGAPLPGGVEDRGSPASRRRIRRHGEDHEGAEEVDD